MTEKDKINNLINYLIFQEAEYKNCITDLQNELNIHRNNVNILLDFVIAQAKYDACSEMSEKIEKIIFDYESRI